MTPDYATVDEDLTPRHRSATKVKCHTQYESCQVNRYLMCRSSDLILAKATDTNWCGELGSGEGPEAAVPSATIRIDFKSLCTRSLSLGMR